MSKLLLQTLVVGQLQTNSYLILDKVSSEAIIIDAGDDADFILRKISDHRVKPVAIIATHGHFDHILAAGELQKSLNIPFLMHSADQFLIDRLEESAQHFLHYKVAALHPTISIDLSTISVLPFFNRALTVLKTPGHTPGSICLYNGGQNMLISGDTLFKSGIGRTDFSYASSVQLEESLQQLKKLPPKTIVHPGHGEPTYIRDEFGV